MARKQFPIKKDITPIAADSIFGLIVLIYQIIKIPRYLKFAQDSKLPALATSLLLIWSILELFESAISIVVLYEGFVEPVLELGVPVSNEVWLKLALSALSVPQKVIALFTLSYKCIKGEKEAEFRWESKASIATDIKVEKTVEQAY